jgi:hypothetical protein
VCGETLLLDKQGIHQHVARLREQYIFVFGLFFFRQILRVFLFIGVGFIEGGQ